MFIEFIRDFQNKNPQAIALIFTIFCSLACVYSLILQLRIWRWPFVWGRLIEKKVTTFGNENSLSDQKYQNVVGYRYTVAGKEYQGKRLSAMVIVASHNSRGLLNNQLKAIQLRGNEVKVYHHPKRHNKSYLIKGSKAQFLSTFFLFSLMIWATWRLLK